MIKKLLNNSEEEFKKYYEKENGIKRLTLVYSFSSLVTAPIFAIFCYYGGLPQMYFYSILSIIFCFPVYIIVCNLIKYFENKLIYFFIGHLYLITLSVYIDLFYSSNPILSLIYFYATFTIILYVMQRLIAAYIYILFVGILLVYALYFNDLGIVLTGYKDFSDLGFFGFYILLSSSAIVILFSRKKLIKGVENYSDYLKTISDSTGVGFILIKNFRNESYIVDYNTNASIILECNSLSFIETINSILNIEQQQKLLNLRKNENLEFVVPYKTEFFNKWIQLNYSILKLNNSYYTILSILNITDRMIEKEELAISEEKYRELYYKNLAGVFTLEDDSKINNCNKAFLELFENTVKIGDFIFKEDRKHQWDLLVSKLRDRQHIKNHQTKIFLSNGLVKYVMMNLYMDNTNHLIEGTIVDLTDIENAHKAIEQSEEKYKLIFETSNDTVILLDGDTIIDINKNGLDLLKSKKEDILQKQLYDFSFVTSEDTREKYNIYKNTLNKTQSVKFEWELKKSDEKSEVKIKMVALNFWDKNYIQCVIRDVTEIRKSERNLVENQLNFKTILDYTPEGILIISDGKILYQNSEVNKLNSGFPIEINELFEEKDQIIFEDQLNKQNHERNIFSSPLVLKEKIGRRTIVDVSFVPIQFEEKSAILIIMKDISLQNKLSKEVLRAEIAEENNHKLANEIKERIKTEKMLQEQFIRSNAIFDGSSNTLLLTLNTAFLVSSYNSHCQNYFWYLTNSKIQINSDFKAYFSKIFSDGQLRVFKHFLNRVKLGESKQIEIDFICKGKKRWIELFINPIFDIEGSVTEFSLVAHDISDKKQNESTILVSLKEKEVLLKEVHHRVKNNLQVISSLLNLQSAYVKDKKTIEILDESINRIKSMSIIHENLYQTNNFSSLDFSNYVLNLATNLISSYQVKHESIKLKTDIKSVVLPLDQAIHCGLIINELVTNSIKYAFENQIDKEIFISLSSTNSKIQLSIQDNGVGLPKDFDFINSKTLGIQLVHTLIDQIEGEIKICGAKGTKYFITFEKSKT